MRTARSTTAREENRRLRRDDVLERRQLPRSLPSWVRVDTIATCASGCRHCFQDPDRVPVLMSRERFQQVVDELFPYVDRVAIGVAGEPIQDPWFGDRLEAFQPDGPGLELTTSGVGLEAWAPTVVPRLARLTVSLEAIDEVLYGLVRPRCDLGNVLRGIEACVEERRRLPEGARPECVARVTVMEGNRDHLPGLVDRVAGLGIDRIVLVHAVPMPGRHPDLGPLSPAAWATVADRVRYQGRASRIAVDLPVMPPLQPRDDTSDGPPVAAGALPDHAPWTQVSIQPDGALAWCCPVGTLPRAATVPWPLGTSFSVPWSHETFQRGRRAASAPPACGLCPQVGKECDGK